MKKNRGKNNKQEKKVFLPEKFWVSKKWKKTSKYSEYSLKSNIEISFKHEKEPNNLEYFLDDSNDMKSPILASLQKQLTEYLSQIQYHYIPAIKDKRYFSHLFGELQQTLWKAKRSDIDDKKNNFEAEIQKETLILMDEFKEILGQKDLSYEPVFQLPANLVDLFKTLQVQTGDIDLTQRGDGVQAKLIPEILNYISIKEKSYTSRTVRTDVQSKKYFIWGFEEPENSYEYKNAQLLANRFKDKFAENAQIFVTTHSFNFLSIVGDNVGKYRVWQDAEISASRISKVQVSNLGELTSEDSKLTDSYKLNEELGVFSLNMKLEEVYLETERIKSILNQKVEEANQQEKCLFVEDKYDQIYKVAWLKINSIAFDKTNIEEKFKEHCSFIILGLEGAGAVCGLLRMKNSNVFQKTKIVGLFDFDKEGGENFHHLKNDKFWGNDIRGDKQTGHYRKRTDHPFWFGMLLPIPERISVLADLSYDNFSSYIEIENLLPEKFLTDNNFVNEKKVVGTKYYKIKDGCKSKLWEKAALLEKESFEDFVQIFNTFNELTSGNP